jgi:hypothetical protein
MNFFNEGHFYRGFKAKFQSRIISIFSTDSKSADLQDDYGTDIFGLQRESLDKLISLKKANIQRNYKQKLRL